MSFPRLRQTAIALAASMMMVGLSACGGGSDDPAPTAPVVAASVPDASMHFNRVATFAVCAQVGASCESATPVNAEIVAASSDGMTLIYTSGLSRQIGFVDITDPAAPVGLGSLKLDGEPTSVAVVGAHALVAVNTSASFTAPTGKLVVVHIATRTKVAELDLGGQPDSVAVSKDGRYAAVVIENERDESVNGGAIPQLPAGRLAIVDLVGAPTAWTRRDVALTGLAALYGTDPEPEYVSINEDNIAVVTLQENNHLALVDLATGKVSGHFSAGSVTLTDVDLTDERPNLVQFNQTQADRLREPDGVTWMSKTRFATANEGDLNGGSRGFTLFNTDGSVAFDVGMDLEYRLARIGHTNDRRNDAKGNEPENVAFCRFGSTDYLFVASERSSVVAVYDMSQPTAPVYKQALPGALSPEGLVTIPSRGLMVSASEVDDRGLPARTALNIYAYQKAAPAYPTIQSADRADGKPIPWSALSGMVAAPSGNTVYAVDDSFFRANRIFTVDVGVTPAVIRSELRITDASDVLKTFGATLPAAKNNQAFDQTDVAAMINADKTVNLDPEGISLASAGGFWIASEGAGSKDRLRDRPQHHLGQPAAAGVGSRRDPGGGEPAGCGQRASGPLRLRGRGRVERQAGGGDAARLAGRDDAAHRGVRPHRQDLAVPLLPAGSGDLAQRRLGGPVGNHRAGQQPLPGGRARQPERPGCAHQASLPHRPDRRGGRWHAEQDPGARPDARPAGHPGAGAGEDRGPGGAGQRRGAVRHRQRWRQRQQRRDAAGAAGQDPELSGGGGGPPPCLTCCREDAGL